MVWPWRCAWTQDHRRVRDIQNIAQGRLFCVARLDKEHGTVAGGDNYVIRSLTDHHQRRRARWPRLSDFSGRRWRRGCLHKRTFRACHHVNGQKGSTASEIPYGLPIAASVGTTPAGGRDVLSKWRQTSFRPPRIGCARVFQRSRSPDARGRAVSHDAKAARTAFVESRLVVKHGEMLAVGFAG